MESFWSTLKTEAFPVSGVFESKEAAGRQERETLTELDDEAGPELAREIDFGEADTGAGRAAGWIGVRFGHPGEDTRSAADG